MPVKDYTIDEAQTIEQYLLKFTEAFPQASFADIIQSAEMPHNFIQYTNKTYVAPACQGGATHVI